MKEKENQMTNPAEIQNESLSPREIRCEARRRLIKAGLMSVPVMMTVQSRPLFAQSIGSTEALSYGGYDSLSQTDSIMPRTSEETYVDPYGNEPFPPPSDDFTFNRSRDPRGH